MKRLGVDVTGKIPAELSADTGRALGRLTGLGWGPRLRALLDSPGEPARQRARGSAPGLAHPR